MVPLIELSNTGGRVAFKGKMSSILDLQPGSQPRDLSNRQLIPDWQKVWATDRFMSQCILVTRAVRLDKTH